MFTSTSGVDWWCSLMRCDGTDDDLRHSLQFRRWYHCTVCIDVLPKFVRSMSHSVAWTKLTRFLKSQSVGGIRGIMLSTQQQFQKTHVNRQKTKRLRKHFHYCNKTSAAFTKIEANQENKTKYGNTAGSTEDKINTLSSGNAENRSNSNQLSILEN